MNIKQTAYEQLTNELSHMNEVNLIITYAVIFTTGKNAEKQNKWKDLKNFFMLSHKSTALR